MRTLHAPFGALQSAKRSPNTRRISNWCGTIWCVEVEDAIWQRQLHGLGRQIVNRVQKLMGSDAVQDVEFRIGIPRRQPQRAEARESSLPQAPQDEADSIQDPILRRVYRNSRRKAVG